MDLHPPLPPLDPALQLQQDIHLRAVNTLHGMLPPPAEDTPEAWLVRDHAALASVACLVPGNPAEGRIAANHVAAMEHASQCLAEVAEVRHDAKQVARLRAQAASMGREARAYLRTLQRMQSIRLKRESKDTTRESAAWTEHCLLGNMTQALERIVGARAPGWTPGGAAALAGAHLINVRLGEAPLAEAPLNEALPAEALLSDAPRPGVQLTKVLLPRAAARALAAQSPEPITAPEAATQELVPTAALAPAMPVGATPSPRASAGLAAATPPLWAAASATHPAGREPADTDEPQRDLVDEVDYYANVYPARLRLIRRHGGLPPNCDFGPPDADLVRAILASSSPAVLAALDEEGSELE